MPVSGTQRLTAFKATGSPTQAFGDDDDGFCYFHVTVNKLHAHSMLYRPVKNSLIS